MDKINIGYFSGTGNSKRVAEIVGKYFSDKNCETEIVSIVKSNPHNFKPAKTNIFIFPTYSFTIPQIMTKYLKKLPQVQNAKAAVLCTFGGRSETNCGSEGRCLVLAKKILTKKGFEVFFTDAIMYPENFTQVMNTLNEEEITAVYKKSDEKVNYVAQKIIVGEQYHKPCTAIKSFLISLFDWSFTVIGRRFFGKLFVADNKCNKCGICIKECPTNTIKFYGDRPFWGYNCQACQRCINICPEKAIQTSLVRTVIFTILFISLFFKIIFLIFHTYLIFIITGAVFYIILYAVLFFIVDLIIKQFEKVKFLSPIFTISYTKNFRRYIAKPF